MIQDVSVEAQGDTTGLPSVLLDDDGRKKNIPELASLAGQLPEAAVHLCPLGRRKRRPLKTNGSSHHISVKQ